MIWCRFLILLVESWRTVVFSGTVHWLYLKTSNTTNVLFQRIQLFFKMAYDYFLPAYLNLGGSDSTWLWWSTPHKLLVWGCSIFTEFLWMFLWGFCTCCTQNMTQILNFCGKKCHLLSFIDSLVSWNLWNTCCRCFKMFLCRFTVDDYIIWACCSEWEVIQYLVHYFLEVDRDLQ